MYFFTDGKLALEQWMEDDHPEFLRTEQSLVDLQYLMSVPPSGVNQFHQHFMNDFLM